MNVKGVRRHRIALYIGLNGDREEKWKKGALDYLNLQFLLVRSSNSTSDIPLWGKLGIETETPSFYRHPIIMYLTRIDTNQITSG